MPNALTPTQAAASDHNGILFPLPVLTSEETRRYRESYLEFEHRLGGHPKATELSQTHLHFPWAYELATPPSSAPTFSSGPPISSLSGLFYKYTNVI
jgi:hypothetical protein